MKQSKAPHNIQTTVKNNKYSRYELPSYLIKHYWWAYLSPLGLKIFDHGFMVNRILWGQYHSIAQDAVELLAQKEQQKVAGISCAYGEFFPLLVANDQIEHVSLLDVAPIQLVQVENKITENNLQHKCHFLIANAEQIPLESESFDSSVLFFLLHELPVKARANVLFEAVRITQESGRLIIADYGERGELHLFHKNKLFSRVFETLEPFLADFWRCDLFIELEQQAKSQGRKINLLSERTYFNGFYRLLAFEIN